MYRYKPDIARARTRRRSQLIWPSQGDSTEASQGRFAAHSPLTGSQPWPGSRLWRIALEGALPHKR